VRFSRMPQAGMHESKENRTNRTKERKMSKINGLPAEVYAPLVIKGDEDHERRHWFSPEPVSDAEVQQAIALAGNGWGIWGAA